MKSILGLLFTIAAVSASYNLYINEHETMRLLGKLIGRQLNTTIIAPSTTNDFVSVLLSSVSEKSSSDFHVACNYSVHFHNAALCATIN